MHNCFNETCAFLFKSDGSIATSCSVSLNVCFVSVSSAFIGGSQNGCETFVFDAKSIILLLVFSLGLIVVVVAVGLATHSSEFVTLETFGRGTDAHFR